MKQMKSNTFTPSLYYLWDKKPKELSTLQYCGMDHDIYAAAVTGTLVMSDRKDHDAMLMKRSKCVKVELKTSYITTKNVFQTKKGSIYVYDRHPIHDALKAQFSKNGPEDDMLVFFVCCDVMDKWDTEVIDVWQMDGEVAIDLLSTNRYAITLKKFMEHGRKKRVKVDTISWGRYTSTLRRRLPIKTVRNI